MGHFLQAVRPQDWVSPGLCLLTWRPSVPTWKGWKGKEITSEQGSGVCPERPPRQSRVPFPTCPLATRRSLVCFLAPGPDPTRHY